MKIIIDILTIAWLFVSYTYVATYYTALMNMDNRPRAQKNLVHLILVMWFFISIWWYFKMF